MQDKGLSRFVSGEGLVSASRIGTLNFVLSRQKGPTLVLAIHFINLPAIHMIPILLTKSAAASPAFPLALW